MSRGAVDDVQIKFLFKSLFQRKLRHLFVCFLAVVYCCFYGRYSALSRNYIATKRDSINIRIAHIHIWDIL